ncbi:MAG TPA: zinc-ribbon domain-containing protein [Candidatus Limnocylindria bacterium]|nr:zinc-ribbon domain-containing protein [Candidatus Limnocylindria bacterium]
MTVHCPHCATAYQLPDRLLGPRGARVRCPKCHGAFLVMAEAGSNTPTATAAESDAPSSAPAPGSGDRSPTAADPIPETVAAEILDELSARLGEQLAEARGRGRLLSELGPAMMDAYEEYRRRLGQRATAVAFRHALRERWALDLGPEH